MKISHDIELILEYFSNTHPYYSLYYETDHQSRNIKLYHLGPHRIHSMNDRITKLDNIVFLFYRQYDDYIDYSGLPKTVDYHIEKYNGETIFPVAGDLSVGAWDGQFILYPTLNAKAIDKLRRK